MITDIAATYLRNKFNRGTQAVGQVDGLSWVLDSMMGGSLLWLAGSLIKM